MEATTVDRMQVREWYRLAREVENTTPVFICNTKYGEIKYFCYGNTACWRADTLHTKEPETIAWIDEMSANSIFWDIGANVGLYSIYAAKKELRVFAFEPSAFNYFLLNKNIEINALQQSIISYPIAISDKSEFGLLNSTMTNAAGSMSTFSSVNEKMDSISCGEVTLDVIFRQGMLSFSIDELVLKYGFEVPNHIKIDVDGIENLVIKGGLDVLKMDEVKSVLVELDDKEIEYSDSVISMLRECGFVRFDKQHSQMIEDGSYASFYNFIFRK